ncbi:major facilitator superfamily domain-containing protein [Mycena rosella]|uniref:Major facilitator superfamily domain-containing protein n=1 Tax=Mycena rosella TaxID=1033263 RepID=A0AAD7G6Z4_MYCRO|nr:major facilitator superfamily domain-containing protein [Mycena rosella]
MSDSKSEKPPSESQLDADPFDSPQDKKLVWKVDLRLIPILTLLYLLSFLDRILGLTTDLHVSAPQYNTALALYFVAYVLFEVPANRFNPRIWLPTLTLIWGIASICQGLVKNQAGLFGIRFFLGVTEAGLFPGVIYLFSVYYRRHERSWRVAIFFGGAALAGAFGGILAFAIGKMEGVGGRRGWQWIFILEGVLTVAVSILAYFVVPTWSHQATFLTETERARLLARLAADSDAARQEKFEWFFVWQAFTDHLVWAYALLFHGFAFVLYSLSLFLPTIIAGLGFSSWQAQLLTVPPNALASLSIWGTVWVSSRYNARAPFIIGSAFVAIIGYIILITGPTAGAQYVGVHFAAAGVYTGNALLLSWPGENVSAQTKRAVAVALQITVGDIGAIAGWIFLTLPRSILYIQTQYLACLFTGRTHIIAIGYLLFAAAVATYLWVWMARENKRRDLLVANDGKGRDLDAGEEDRVQQERLGDRSVFYRYVI